MMRRMVAGRSTTPTSAPSASEAGGRGNGNSVQGGQGMGAALDFLDRHHDGMGDEFFEFLRIPSVSPDPAYAANLRNAVDFLGGQLAVAGMEHVEVLEVEGSHPAIYADWLHAPGAPTILVYGHYDVQPPDPLGAWASPPFEPTLRDGRIYCRGVSDDKAPMFIPVKVAEAFLKSEGRLPVNVRFLLEIG